MPQSLAQVYIHTIFSTLERKPLVASEWRDELFSVVGGVINQTGCQTLVVGGTADHAHALVRLSRTITIADLLCAAKAQSSAWVNQTYTSPAPFHWQSGYGAFSVSESNVESVRAYILRQEEHHRTRCFQDEFRELLRRHRVEWDEQFVWD